LHEFLNDNLQTAQGRLLTIRSGPVTRTAIHLDREPTQ